MSDGISDMYRDMERSEKAETYFTLLHDYLKSRSETDLAKLHDAAESVDSVSRGLITSRTSHSKRLSERIKALQSDDRHEWALVLRTCMDDVTLFQKLKELSPFAHTTIIFVNYGHGFVTIEGELKKVLTNLIREHDLETYDCDEYLVSIPQIKKRTTQIEWISCGILGQREPRTAKGKNNKKEK